MAQFINLLAIQLPDWSIPWAGIGGFLLGLGSALSGYAALMTARRGRNESSTPVNSKPDDGGSERVSDVDSSESK